jgi:hypothetical protein
MSLSRVLWRTTLVVVSLLAIAVHGLAADADAERKPEEVVKLYLESIQKGDYKTAYPLLSSEMRGNLDEEKWIAQQTVVMKLGEVSISSFRVFPAKMEGNKAIVPNLLKSKDKFINQGGLNEYELYTLVLGPEKKWQIDQQALVETDAIHKWFPADVPVE